MAIAALLEPKRVEFPCREQLLQGRSVFGEFVRAEAPNAIKVFRTKGAFGLKEDISGRLLVYKPNPQEAFVEGPRTHIALDPNADPCLAYSKHKFLFGLGAQNANTEFAAAKELSSARIGFAPIMAGEFTDSSGKPLLDYKNDRTGAVVITQDPLARPFYDYMNFRYIDNIETAQITLPLAIKSLPGRQHPLEFLVNGYLEFAERLARVKTHALVEGGVGRHSSHSGNFYFNPASGQTYMTDLDTCVMLRDQIQKSKGPQLLRDHCTAILRTFGDLFLFAHSPDFTALRHNFSPSIFYPYLRGAFGPYAENKDILSAATRLNSAYLNGFLQDRIETLSEVSKRFNEAVLNGDSKTELHHASVWDFIHKPFIIPIYYILRDLINQCRLPEAFVLPPIIDQKAHIKRFHEIVHEWRDACIQKLE